MHDLYHFKKLTPDTPLIAVIDEFQRLNTSDDSSLATIIRDGRKFGWSLWLSSQLATGKLLKNLSSQASLQVYFSLGSKGNRSVANMLGTTTSQKNNLFETLQGFSTGEFLFQQDGSIPVRCDGKQEHQ